MQSNKKSSSALHPSLLRSLFRGFSPSELKTGQLLLELLIVIGVVAIIAAIVAPAIYTSLRSNQSGSEKNVALGLAESSFDGIRSVATGNWLALYNLTHGSGSTAYYPMQSAGTWTITTGTQSIPVNNDTYSISFYVQNVCRSTSTQSILGITDSSGTATSSCATNGGLADPSTQWVTASVSWPTGGPVSYSDYVTRWRDLVCAQSSWNAASSAVASCPGATTYSSTVNVTASSSLQLCAGGC